MGSALSKRLTGGYETHKTVRQLYELYNDTMSELEIYARYVPGQDDLQDKKFSRQESILIQIQDEIISYAANCPIPTLEDAVALSAFWRLLTAPDGNECSELTNRLARNLMDFYESRL